MISRIALALAIAAVSTNATAQSNDMARGIVVIAVYDSKCDTLPKAVLRVAELASGSVSMQTMKTETAEVLASIQELGVGVWCTATKPLIHTLMKTIH